MKTPQVCKGKSLELLKRYHKSRSVVIRNKIAQLNVGLVHKVAHQMSRRSTETYEDLVQIGCLGLIRAIERFDASQGAAFSSFAMPYIRGEILHYLRDRSSLVRIPRRWQNLQRSAQQAQAKLTQRLGRTPTDQELASQLQLSQAEWQQVRMAKRNRAPLSLDTLITQQSESTITLGETLLDRHSQDLQATAEDQQQVRMALVELDSQTRLVIELVYFKGLSRKAVAIQLGVSPMTVSRRIRQGLQQMNTVLGAGERQVA